MKLRKVLSLFVALVMMFEVLPVSSLATEIVDATENVEVSAETVAEAVEEEAETKETVEETDVSAESDVVLGNTAEGVLIISSSVTRTASLAVASVSAASSSEESETTSDEVNAEDANEESNDSTADEAEVYSDDVIVEDETISDDETVEDVINEYLIATVSDDSTVVDSGTCGADGDNLTWVLTSDGTLTISGEGEMENFHSDYYVPWYSYNESIFNVVISYGVTSVGSNAFSGCSSITGVSLANSITTLGDFVFSGCTSLSEITIPSSIVTCKTYGPFSGLNIERVTFESDVIPKGILRNCKTLKYVVFSNGVTEIEQAAFRDCISLETIDLPEGLTTIGSYAFAGCTALYDVTLPESVTTIGSYAFLDCTSLLDINLPSSIESCGTSGPFSGSGIETVVCNATTIPSYTFRDCSELRYVMFSADTTEIGIYAFWNCISLSDITLPESIETLGYNIFYGCTSLTEINIPSSFVSAGHHNDYGPFYGSSIESVTYEATVIPAYTFKGCSTLTNVNFIVPTIEIGNYAFENCTSLQSITLPQELTSLGVMAFYNCSSLESIELSAGLTSIGGVAFGECTSLQSVVLPDSLTSIEMRAFSGCTSLADITLPDKLVSIGAYAFENCTSLKTINIPINLSEASYAFTESCIEEVYCDAAVVSVRVFSDCTTLSKVTFTENTTEIKAYAFSGCTSLKEVSLPSSLTDLRNYVFADCTSLECVEMSEGLLSIGDYVFSGCSSLYDISLPDTVTTLGILIFSGCSSLKEINLPLNLESVTYMAKGGTFSDSYIEKIVCNSTTIPENTCRDCTSLKTVEFVGNTVEISYNAFRDCTSLCEITLPDTLTTIASRAFSGCTELKSINLPENLSDAKYAFTDSCIEIVYCQLSVIPEFVFYDCSTLVTVELSESTTEIGSDAFSECTSLCNISFPDGIISIGVFSFGNCISLSNVTLPDSLTTIGAEAFEGCTSLTSINIPANVTSAYMAFYDSSLKNVSFDATTIPSYTFYGCDALTTIVFNSDLLEVGDYAFCGCTALSDFTLPSSVTTLGSYIFKDCTSLTSVNLPRDLNVVEYSLSLTAYCPFTGSSIETIVCEADVIPAYTFYGFTTLKTVTFTGNTTEICGHAFQGCTALSDITLPDSLTTIGEGAFYGCTSLTSINLPINIATVEYSTHGYCPFANSNIETVVCEANVVPAYTFYNYTTLTTVTFTGNTTEIGKRAFYGCTGLSDITLPNSLTTIGERAFYGCESLTEINLPVSLTTVTYSSGYGPFTGSALESVVCEGSIVPDYTLYKCTSLTTVTFTGNTTEIGDYAFSGCSSLTEIEFPSSLTSLGSYVFNACTGITEVTIPSGLTSCGENGSFNGSSITTATISDGMTSIPEHLFRGCSTLTSLIIPVSITEVGEYATYRCLRLYDVYYAGTESQWDNITINSNNNLTATSTRTIHYESTGGTDSGDSDLDTGLDVTWSIMLPIVYYGDQNTNIGSIYIRWDEDDIGKTITLESSNPSVLELVETTYEYTGESQMWYLYANALSAGTSTITFTTSDGITGSKTIDVEYKENKLTLKLSGMKYLDDGTPYIMVGDTVDVTATPVLNTALGDTTVKITTSDSGKVSLGTANATFTVDEQAAIQGNASYQVSATGNSITADTSSTTFSTSPITITCTLTTSNGADELVVTQTIEVNVFDEETLETATTDAESRQTILQLIIDWYTSYNNYTQSVYDVLESSSADSLETTIELQAEALQLADSKSNSKLVNFVSVGITEEQKSEVYIAVATFIAKETTDMVDLDSISVKDVDTITIAANIVSQVYENLDAGAYPFEVNGHTYTISGLTAYGQYTRTISCDGVIIAGLTSTYDETIDAISAYLDELLEIEENLLKEASRQVFKTVVGQSLSDLTSAKIKSLLSKYTTMFQNTGVGSVVTVVENCIDYFKYCKSVINYAMHADENPLSGLTAVSKAMQGFDFNDNIITDKSVKSANKALQTVANKLCEAVEQYATTGEVDIKGIVLEGWETIKNYVITEWKCPVSIKIYDSTGTQIGYVGDDDLWYDESLIYIEKYGDVKTIYSHDTDLTFEIVGTGTGTLCCTFEEYVDGEAIGRVNYYDISLYEGKQLTAEVAASNLTEENAIVYSVDEGKISASEYIASEDYDEATVKVSTTSNISDAGSVYGSGYYTRGDAVTLQAIPDDGYKIVGWINENGAFVSVSAVYEFTAQETESYTAVFVENSETYTITFDANGGDVFITSGSTNSSGVLTTLPTPTREGYSFDGWYTSAEDGDEVTTETVFIESTTVYAHWTVEVVEHTHTLTHVEAKDATCTEDGNTEYWYCSDCDTYFSDEDATTEIALEDTVKEATGHDYESVVTNPTCTEGGYTTYTCSNCGDSYVADETEATGHSYEAVVTEPTCTEDGYTTYVCSECGDTYTDEETEALGHDYESVVTKEPTCTETGIMTYTCTRCGDSYTEEIDMIDHTYGEPEWTWVWSETEQTYNVTAKFTCTVCGGTDTETALVTSETTDATCTATGSTVYTAVVDMDGTSYSDTKTVELPMIPHTEGEAVTENEVAATCTTEGSYDTVIYCSVCGEELSRETIAVPATGHTTEIRNAVDATCTEDGYTGDEVCTVCGETVTVGTVIPATGHSFNSEGVCEACGAKTGEDGTASTVTVESDDTIFANVLPSGLVTSVTISISNDNSGTLVVSTVVEVSAYPYLVEHIADTLSFTLYNEAQGDDLISETNSFTITTTENNKKTLKKVSMLFYGDVDYSGTGTSTVTMDFASASDLSSSDIYVLHYTGSYPTWEVVTSTVTFGDTAVTIEFEASDYSPFVVLSVASASSGGSSSIIDILLRISANYSAVTEAIDRANALNPSDYENFLAVTEAINAVNWNLKAINQLTVNAYADAINTAIDNLVKTTATITEETVNVAEPIEDTNTDTEDDEEEKPSETSEPETNPITGLTLSILPMVIAALAATASKRR